ncbi:MAG: hypothetical protein J6D21_06480 [Clostridia bacterium]|nr:hypothetical protein [Clostridia bacterium]
MFDAKTKEAYHKIRPSDSLRERVLAVDTAPARAKVLTFRRMGNLAACFVAVVMIAMLAAGLTSDPYRVVLGDGTSLGNEARTVTPDTAYYIGSVPFSLSEERMRPELTAAENCLHLELHSPEIATVTVEAGNILLYDGELGEYVDCGNLTYFEGECKLWWCLPTLADGECCILTVCADTCTRVAVRCDGGAYTASLLPED